MQVCRHAELGGAVGFGEESWEAVAGLAKEVDLLSVLIGSGSMRKSCRFITRRSTLYIGIAELLLQVSNDSLKVALF